MPDIKPEPEPLPVKIVPQFEQIDEANYVANIDDNTIMACGVRQGNARVIGKLRIPGVVSPFIRLAAFDSILPTQHYIDLTVQVDNEIQTIAQQMNIDSSSNTINTGNDNISFEFNTCSAGTEHNEYGGMDAKINFNSQPDSNQIVMSIDDISHVQIYLQPPLTEEFQDGWNEEFQKNIIVTATDVKDEDGNVLVHRPAHVVGSLCIYSDYKGGMVTQDESDAHITTGKIGNFYAYPLVDKPNEEYDPNEWATWSFDDSNLYLTIPQEFLDNAVYPLTLTPIGDTFGYTTCGAAYNYLTVGYVDGSNNFLDGQRLTGAAGTGVSISAYIGYINSTGTCKYALYNNSSPSNMITNGVTNQGNVTTYAYTTGQGALLTLNFASAPTLTAVTYNLIAWGNNYQVINYDSATGTQVYNNTASTYSTFPTNVTWGINSDFKVSIYCTYTPGGGGTNYPETLSSKIGLLSTTKKSFFKSLFYQIINRFNF